jgi:hypothetical protein
MSSRGTRRSAGWCPRIGFAAASLLLPASAAATLGGDQAAVANVQARTHATMHVTCAGRYTLHEMRLGTQTTVREYRANAGKVFAVTWQGPWRPDLRLLLGGYYQAFVEAARAPRRARGPVAIRLPGLVVELAGHQRAFYGRAYLPDAVPPGLRVEDLR